MSAPTSSTLDGPRLPTELIEQILELAWHSDTSREDRSRWLMALPLVNSTFLVICRRLFFRWVHVPCFSYALNWLDIPRHNHPDDPDLIFSPPPDILRMMCQSITLYTSAQLDRLSPGSGSGLISHTLYKLSHFDIAPNLTELNFVYHDRMFADFFNSYHLFDLPPTVTSLSIRFEMTKVDRDAAKLLFARRIPMRDVDASRRRHTQVHTLEVLGTCAEFVRDVLHYCDGVKSLTYDGIEALDSFGDARLQKLILRPPTRRTLRLQDVPVMMVAEARVFKDAATEGSSPKLILENMDVGEGVLQALRQARVGLEVVCL
ncbi:hypothetical protein PENSPDRAFT_584545 [Peniophora sp. CONT]|nr:hypothetical protein PENSPDRAFT_584545 [Peniophora sp. CONT]